MLHSFANMQKLSQENLEATIKAVSAFSSNAQAIAQETAEFARNAFEHNSAAVENLAGAQTLDKAVEVQTAYVKGAYESFIGQAGKVGGLYAALAADTFKPFEGLFSRAVKG